MKRKKLYTKADFANKTDYEGGVGEMLGYQGRTLSEYDLPEGFEQRWSLLHDLYMEIANEVQAWDDGLAEKAEM